MKPTLAVIAGTASLMLSTPALAVGNPLEGLQAMKELNLIVLGDLTHGQHVQGKAFIGGDLKGSLIAAQGGTQGYATSDRAHLTVGGNANTYTVESALGSPVSVRIGGNSTGTAGINGNGHVDVGGTFNLSGFNPNATKTYSAGVAGLQAAIAGETSALRDDLGALSLYLKDLPATAAITSISSPLAFGAGNFFVFNMTEAAFEQQNANFDTLFTHLTNNGTTVIINVAGHDLDQNGGANLNDNGNVLNQNVIWNFYEADTLDLKGWHGSVLAPLADLTNTSTIWGSVVANDFAMEGEVHLGTFHGDVPPPPGTAVPEPAAWIMMILGFGLVGGLARRRRNQAAIG